MNNQKCFECHSEGSLIFNQREGTIVCTNCGEVQQIHMIDETSEWRNFGKDNTSLGPGEVNRAGVVNNRLLKGQGLGTIISGDGLNLPKWIDESAQTGNEKALVRGFRTIEEKCQKLQLNDYVVEEAQKIFKNSLDQKSLKGRPYEAIVSACIFIACRQSNPRSFREIGALTNVDQKNILKCFSKIKSLNPYVSISKTAVEYASRYSNQFDFTPLQVRAARMVAENTIELGFLTGKSPLTVASAAVYIVGKLYGNDKSFSEISTVSSMKDITIRNCYREMQPRRYELMRGLDPALDPNRLQPVQGQ